MLVDFSFKNFGPFREETTIDFRAVKAYKEHPYMLKNTKFGNILKVAAVYGANAAGKSQLVSAYNHFSRMVSDSFGGDLHKMVLTEEEQITPIERVFNPFLFSEEGDDATAEFEATYIEDEGQYRYGFLYNKDRILAEWLYFVNIKTGRQSTILERTTDDLGLGPSVKRECRKYENEIRPDTLALSFFKNLSLANNVFSNTARSIQSVMSLPSTVCSQVVSFGLEAFFCDIYNSEKEKSDLLKFLSAIDSSIKDFTIERTKSGCRVTTHHIGPDGRDYQVPLSIESDGTKKTIVLYALMKNAIEKGRTLLIDELDAQLHPLLFKHLVSMFYDDESEGQLIYTAHDATFLDKKYIRRDQIWIVQKDEKGQASLVSIADFKPRNDLSLSTSYLSGVFGGIPNILIDED